MNILLNFPQYDSYKDSEVEWFGEIPSHWKENPIVSITEVKSITNKSDEELLSVYLNLGVIRFSDISEKRTNVTSQDLSKYQLVEPGDFVMNNQQAWRGSVGVSKFKGIVSPAYIILKLSKRLDSIFANYLLRDSAMVSQYLINSKGVGTIQRNLYWPQMKRATVLLPPFEEQIAIAKFLDDKTAKIDQAIAIKEKQIELLKERKQILIQNAVTRGLNPNVPMKDSGVEWIGEIPEHWNVLPGRCFFKENKRKNIGLKDERVLSLSYGNIIIKPKEKLIGLVPESFETYQIVRPGDIIIRCTDLQNDKTSLRTGLAKNVGIITSAYLNLGTKGNNNSEFMHLFLHTLDVTKEIYKYGSGLRQNLSFEDFKTLDLLKVPIEEQNQIVKHLKSNSKIISGALDHLQNQIEKLKEYKSTLINSAVTGKIKVV